MDLSRVAGSNYHYRRFTFESFLRDAAEVGYKTLELWASGPQFHLEDYSDKRLEQLRTQIADLGMRVACLTPEQYVYPIGVSNPDPVYRRRSIDFFKRHMDAAVILGCELMVVTPGFSMLDVPVEDGKKWALEAFRELAEKAEAVGVDLAMEAFTVHTTNVVNTAAGIRELIDAIASPRFRGLVDVDVIANSGLESLDGFIEALGSANIRHVHFVDGLPGGHLVPGEGALDMTGAFNALEAAGYTGCYGMELLDRRYFLEPGKALENYLNWFKKL